ncbi:hypothetical protein [Actinoplanes derwentensis]|uniref:Lipoprotein LprG n=1 Tax=Actinoplanes derwentensis TaxID=113562 RepID=A0A1H2ART3_9ACTN|nr:hypothetical protein [Actinoplanes derwentensis]GID84354.1 hypothetical protein Ade03nite_32780 [Actinoplanes derwentensis]SDT48755.1 hypothetical protein SAMN04489716_4055 [Actinoplanes derwentensis]
MRKFAFRVGFAAVAATAMLLSGCGSSDSDGTGNTATVDTAADNGVAALGADEILTKAKDALKKAGSYRMKGSATESGTTMNLDFRISGTDLQGTLSLGESADIELLSVGGQQYMKPSEGFWTMLGMGAQAKTMTEKLAGKWVLVPTTDESLTGIFGAANVDEVLKPTGTLAKGEATEIAGTPVITLTDSGDAENQMFVATKGEPYPVKLGTATGDGVAFSDFGASFTDIKAPAEGEYIKKEDLS